MCNISYLVLFSSEDRRWKITDFGFTTEGSSKRVVVTTYSRGTTCYRAPELLCDSPIYTNKVDIWAFGCIAYEVLTGKRAFSGDQSARECLRSDHKFQVLRLAGFNAVSRYFETLISDTLVVDWGKRRSAWDIAKAINLEVLMRHLLINRGTLVQWPRCPSCRPLPNPKVVLLCKRELIVVRASEVAVLWRM